MSLRGASIIAGKKIESVAEIRLNRDVAEHYSFFFNTTIGDKAFPSMVFANPDKLAQKYVESGSGPAIVHVTSK